MANPLLDILPVGRDVAVGRGKLPVFDVPLSFFGRLLARFPELRSQINAGTATFASALISLPDALPMFLAAGIGQAGNAEAEEAMGKLGSRDQLHLLNEILIETKGSDTDRPLIERVKAVAKTLGLNPVAIDRLIEAMGKIELDSSDSPTTSDLPSNT